MKLYSYYRSSSAWRVRIALNLKEVEHSIEPVHLRRDGGEHRSAAHVARNPMAQVPTLEWNEDGIVRRLSQSVAIMTYLDERYPDPPLFPTTTAYARARALQLAEVINSFVQPLQNMAVLVRLEELGADVRDWAVEHIARGLDVLELEAVRGHHSFLVADHPTIADCCLVPQLYNARRFGVNLEVYPRLSAIEERCATIPAFEAARPERQIDYEPE